MPKKTIVNVKLDPNMQRDGKHKLLGGCKADEWNDRLNNLTVNALPIAHSKNTETITAAALAVCCGTIDVAPADPIEGILIAQLMVANEAALAMYRKGWEQPSEYFVARTKYLQLADKAARTFIMPERLDHHRGRGQQQITVKHVTTTNVTADQAIIAESITTGGKAASPPALLAASSEMAMPILDHARLPELVGVGGAKKRK